MKKVYDYLFIALGYVLSVAGFIIFGGGEQRNILILNILMTFVIVTHVALYVVFPMIRRDKPEKREVGMMGIHYFTVIVYSVLAISFMLLGKFWHWRFVHQAFAQACASAVLLLGYGATLQAGEKVEQVYGDEQAIMEAKNALREAMDALMDQVATLRELAPEIKGKLIEIQESMRFISPSSAPEAKELNEQFCEAVADLRMLMRNPTQDNTHITEAIDRLENILQKRKKY
jgi:energy-converting hydrogenase Eha subunit A